MDWINWILSSVKCIKSNKIKLKKIPYGNLCTISEHNNFYIQVALVYFLLPNPNTSTASPCSLMTSGIQGKHINQSQVIVQNMFYGEDAHMGECDMVFWKCVYPPNTLGNLNGRHSLHTGNKDNSSTFILLFNTNRNCILLTYLMCFLYL